MIFESPLFLRLLVAHLLADFALQPRAWVTERRMRSWRSRKLYWHAAIHALLVYGAACAWLSWWVPLLVFASHAAIDCLKARSRDSAAAFLLDQTAHLAVLALISTALVAGGIAELGRPIAAAWRAPRFWVYVAGYLLVIWPAGALIDRVAARWRDGLEGERGLSGAGFWIGWLERVLTVSFVLAGHLEAIGLLVAAKSIFRFGEIKDPSNRCEAEYILIGSMLSYGIALAVGYWMRMALGI